MQWNMLDQNYYGACSSTPTEQAPPPSTEPLSSSLKPPIDEGVPSYQPQIGNSPPQILKRKRSLNPQSEENFIKALEAVRFGGIGFCKAARMYGVNNRTLWLEYKKRGYPNFRLSIKNRKQEQGGGEQQQKIEPQMGGQPGEEGMFLKQEYPKLSGEGGEQVVCATSGHPVALISGTFFEGKPVDLGPVLHRPKYLDPSLINGQGINFHSINFEQM